MDVRNFPLGPLQTNCFVAMDAGSAVAVDPGGNPAAVVDFLRQQNLTLTHILLTHLHCDHIFGVKALQDATGAPVLANPDDGFLLETEIGGGGFMGLPAVDEFSFETLRPGEQSFLDRPCQVLATPGHTPGSLSFHFSEDGHVFVGDLLFSRSIGRTDFPGGDMEALKASVIGNIFTLPDDTVVHPGHGPDTTVADERTHNPFFVDYQSM